MKVTAEYTEGQESLEGLVRNGVVDTRIARSRFLRASGAALFGGAMVAFLPRSARAHCPPDAVHPCYGYPLCYNGDGGCENTESGCCRSDLENCDPHCAAGYQGCPTGTACWYCCHQGTRYKCCDCCRSTTRPCPSNQLCICRFRVGTCSCGSCPGPAGC